MEIAKWITGTKINYVFIACKAFVNKNLKLSPGNGFLSWMGAVSNHPGLFTRPF